MLIVTEMFDMCLLEDNEALIKERYSIRSLQALVLLLPHCQMLLNVEIYINFEMSYIIIATQVRTNT